MEKDKISEIRKILLQKIKDIEFLKEGYAKHSSILGKSGLPHEKIKDELRRYFRSWSMEDYTLSVIKDISKEIYWELGLDVEELGE